MKNRPSYRRSGGGDSGGTALADDGSGREREEATDGRYAVATLDELVCSRRSDVIL